MIASQDRADFEVAQQVLGWVDHANRPLTLKEIQHALSVEPEQSDLDEETMIERESVGVSWFDQDRPSPWRVEINPLYCLEIL